MATASFWDVVEGRADLPPIAVLLGFELRAIDPDARTIEVRFTARPEFCNPAGHIQGGMLAAMLDDTLGPALVATLDDGQWAPTTDLHVQFLAPALSGPLLGRGRVTRKGRQVAFLAGELSDPRSGRHDRGPFTVVISRSRRPAACLRKQHCSPRSSLPSHSSARSTLPAVDRLTDTASA
ncbi:MAG: PaaI family thioesterase [Sciscionella sp.]